MKVRAAHDPNQFGSPTSRKEREKWGTLKFFYGEVGHPPGLKSLAPLVHF
jgi:hypothetical protein